MDNFNGYKLKPKEYSIQPNDIIIRVKDGGPSVPINSIGIAKGHDFVNLPSDLIWDTDYSDWRAIEIKPGSEAMAGNTVYCIKDTGGSCRQHDSFVVSKYYSYSNNISPVSDHKLLIGDTTREDWSWSANNFVVLVKEELSTVSPEPTPVDPFEAKPGDYVEWAEGSRASMTLGNFYKVLSVFPNTLRITDDLNNEDTWSRSRFKRVPDKAIQDPVLISSDDNIDALAYALRIPISYISIDSMMHKPTQPKQNSKGKQMNSNLFTDILKLLTQTEQTDLEKAPSTYAFFYNNEGEYEGTARVANEAEAKALLQKPEHLGYTMRIYSFSDEFTTKIPVVSTINKVVKPEISKAPKAPRKPRAPKAI